ncbi:helix-turn-helix transcriptional regulator [Paraflavitalea speifideaquila]|uniref:helix-turn-helix transcriptional regulator n=1 Tax=Paraflavitalea speifideaquila TaxID=3076558 RepID=UPI0028E55351|nr:helix-turn-helix transcriptional regulator [Paraflavitalea speifideiaquila]
MLGDEESLPGLNQLSEREIEVINLIRDGLASKEIAARLNIAIKTVEVHRHNILKNLK